jgi:nitrite reductase/ring-hydroxylating ferredoxin subunit
MDRDARVQFVDVGRIDDFTVGEFVRVDIPGKDVFVLRAPDGAMFAIKNTCPHHGAPICRGKVDGTFVPSRPGEWEWGREYRMVRCPHHSYEFDLESGEPLFVAGTGRLVRYDVRVSGERVLISLKGK